MNNRLGIWLFTVASVIALSGVLLLDLLPVLPFGGYAEQRWLLLILSGWLVVAGLAFLWVLSNRQVVILPSSLLLIVALAFSFPFLAFLTPLHNTWRWVEPGMYTFYFLAVGFSGLYLAVLGKAFLFCTYLAMAAAVACFLYGAMTVNVYLFVLASDETRLTSYIPWGFVNIRYWSHIATWLLPVLPLAAMAGPLGHHRLWRGLVAIGAGLWWWILLLSTGRGSMLGILIGLVLATTLFGRLALPWLKKSAFYLLLGVGFWLLLSVLIPALMFDEIELRTLKTDSAGRVPLFIEAWRMSFQNFPFGMGPQSWLTHEPLTEIYRNSRKFGHPHNMYLMWAAEYGWLLMVAFMAVAISLWARLWRLRRNLRANAGKSGIAPEHTSERALMTAAISASVVGALVHAGVSAVFMAPGSMLVGLFVLTAFWSILHSDFAEKESCTETQSLKLGWTSRVFLLGLTACVAVVWWFWALHVWDYQQAMMLDEATYFSSSNDGILPRFWFHGNFPR